MGTGEKAYRVLVIDDEPLIRALMSRLLPKNFDVEVVLAEDGEEAVRRLQSEKVDHIISDVMLPNLDGVGIFRWMVANQPEYIDRFVFMTAFAGDPQFRALLSEFPRVPVVGKPFDPNAFDVYLQKYRLAGSPLSAPTGWRL